MWSTPKLWAPLNPLRPPSAHCASPKPVDPLTPQDMSVEDMAVVCVHNIPPQPESPRSKRLEKPQCRSPARKCAPRDSRSEEPKRRPHRPAWGWTLRRKKGDRGAEEIEGKFSICQPRGIPEREDHQDKIKSAVKPAESVSQGTLAAMLDRDLYYWLHVYTCNQD